MKLLQRISSWMRVPLADNAAAERERDDARQREFLKWLNHELRTPLTALSAAAQVLEAAEPGSPDAVEARAIIARQTQLLTHVVGELPSLYSDRKR